MHTDLDGVPAERRRLVYRAYGIVGPVITGTLLLLGRWPRNFLIEVVGLLLCGAIWTAFRRNPGIVEWFVIVVAIPTACCGLGFLGSGERGAAFLALLGGPLACAAVLFDVRAVVASLAFATVTVFLSLSSRLGYYTAAVSTLALSPVAGLVAWVIYDRAARLREAHREQAGLLEKDRALVKELQEALQNVKTLSGLLPVCSWCNRIRTDEGYWKEIHEYVSERTTHGMCPECYAKMKPPEG